MVCFSFGNILFDDVVLFAFIRCQDLLAWVPIACPGELEVELAKQVGHPEMAIGDDLPDWLRTEHYQTWSYLTVPPHMPWQYVIDRSLEGCDLI